MVIGTAGQRLDGVVQPNNTERKINEKKVLQLG